MYNLRVENNYSWALKTHDGTPIPSGTSKAFDNQGNMVLEVTGIGAFNFMDLGEKKLPGYPEINET